MSHKKFDKPMVLGRYSPSQNGVVVSAFGLALCLSGGGAMAMMLTSPKY